MLQAGITYYIIIDGHGSAAGDYQMDITMRDTDWFHMTIPPWGSPEIIGDAEHPTYMYELAPQDCGSVGIVQSVIIGPCNEGYMSIYGPPDTLVWFWVCPTTFSGPVNEYSYVLDIYLFSVETEQHSWTSVKSLFQ